MSFGFSIGDFALLSSLAYEVIQGCKKAGGEYIGISGEVRCLRKALKSLRKNSHHISAQLVHDVDLEEQLDDVVINCEDILGNLKTTLGQYQELRGNGQPNQIRVLWLKLCFSSRLADLPVIRGKLASYTRTIFVILQTLHFRAVNKLGEDMRDGFGETTVLLDNVAGKLDDGLKNLGKHLARAHKMGQAGDSMVSFSTYDGDSKETWREFRRGCIQQGFTSKELEKFKDSIQAHMLDKVHNSGLSACDADSGNSQEKLNVNETTSTFNHIPSMVVEPLRFPNKERSSLSKDGIPIEISVEIHNDELHCVPESHSPKPQKNDANTSTPSRSATVPLCFSFAPSRTRIHPTLPNKIPKGSLFQNGKWHRDYRTLAFISSFQNPITDLPTLYASLRDQQTTITSLQNNPTNISSFPDLAQGFSLLHQTTSVFLEIPQGHIRCGPFWAEQMELALYNTSHSRNRIVIFIAEFHGTDVMYQKLMNEGILKQLLCELTEVVYVFLCYCRHNLGIFGTRDFWYPTERLGVETGHWLEVVYSAWKEMRI